MYLPDVQLHEAATLEDASAFLRLHGDDARLMAGGTDILVDLKTGRLDIAHVISIGAIEQLRGITINSDGLRIGAMTTITELDSALADKPHYVVLRDAAGKMAARQIRNVATVGGNIAGAVPCADLPPTLLVMKAQLEIWSPRGTRIMPLGECLLGPRETALRADEILLAVLVPPPPKASGAAYERFALREGNAIAVASVAASVELTSNGLVKAALLALGSVAPMPKPVDSVSELLAGRTLDDDALHAASEAAMRAAEPISDIRGSAEYRRELVGILTKRALLKAALRAGGDEA